MSYVEPGKWTCPTCAATVTVNGSDADIHNCIHAAQLRHSKSHAKACRTIARHGTDHQPTVAETVPQLVIAHRGRT